MTAAPVFYLLEDLDPAFDGRNLRLVSLNPGVSYFFTQKKISYQIPEDFYEELRLRQGEEEYFLEQLEWFRRFDAFLRNEIRYCGQNQLSLARDQYLILKYFVDSVIIQAKILQAMVSKIGAAGGSIVYIRNKSKSQKAQTVQAFRKREREPLWAEMLPEVCRLYGVRYDIKDIEDKVSAPSLSAPSHSKPKISYPLKAFAREIRQFFHFQKYFSWSNSEVKKPLSVFFAHTGSQHLDPLVQNLIRDKNRVYTFVNGEGRCLSEVMPHPQAPCSMEGPDQELKNLESDCRQAAGKFKDEKEKILSSIIEKCGFPVDGLLLPYFEDFISNQCFSLLKRVRELRRFYVQNSIDFVASHTASDVDSQCALIAARLTPGIKTVGIQHGSDVFYDRAWQVHDLGAFDYYFASDGLSEDKFRRASTLDYLESAEILQSPHYLKNVQTKTRKNRGSSSNQGVKKVLYVPTRLSGHVRYFNCLVYPTQWFFEYQKTLIEYFLKQTHLEVIYKHAITFDRFGSDSIIPFIESRQPSNIQIVTGRVTDSLKGIDAVIMDRPTTAFFEVVASGLPVLAIYPSFIQTLIDPCASDYFGKSLQPFLDVRDATCKIDAFLKSDMTEYQKPLPLKEISFSETLRQIQSPSQSVPRKVFLTAHSQS